METVTADSQESERGSDAGEHADPSLGIAAYPLAIPLMASPAALVAVTATIAESKDMSPILAMTGVIAIIHLVDLLALRACRLIVALLNPEILLVAAKVLAVLLTGLAVELILTGITDFGPIAKALTGTH